MSTDSSPIVYVHSGIWPSPSPSTIFVSGTAWGLAHHSQCVFILRNGSTASTASVFRSITDQDLPETLKFHRVGLGEKTPGHTRFFLHAVRTIGKLAMTTGVRAVITRNIGFLPYLRYIRKRYHIPCMFEAHDFFGDLDFRSDLSRSIKNIKRSRFERHLLPSLDGLICLTDTQQNVFTSHYSGIRSVVAPTGLMTVTRNALPDDQTLCYTGSLDPHKGLGLVLAALGSCTTENVKLHIIGGKSDEEKQRFMSFAHLMGVAARVQLTSWVHHSDIGHLIDQCRAGLVPLQDTPFNRHLTSPLKMLDYFSRCRPVIAADLPSIRCYIKPERHGLLFKPDNSEDLAHTIDRFFAEQNVEKYTQMIEQDAQKYLWTERGKSIYDFIISMK